MKCLRCGYCCTSLLVVVINDPDGPFDETNFIAALWLCATGEPDELVEIDA